ncbi:protein kinase domain-containing protein [Nocardia sp. CA-084685]|uniref:protein kinase domain-containing protein n=1 Tax=Nocardia sp. CA-084685 TaxID=3239970 RepID=UPI003D98349A
MDEFDEAATQGDLPTGIAAELAAAGFGDATEIGRGGFGVVYCCYEYALERYVAVKLLRSEVTGDEREQFLREQRALGRLFGHPQILQVLQVDITATGRPYIVMPYYACGSLESVLRDSGPLRWSEVLSIGVKMAAALAAAHAIGIVHRDVKPGNILLTDYGEPQLADFGIAQFGDVTTSALRTVQGTPAFTAPEVLSGSTPTPISDIYGLGATLHCLLAGRAAFARRTGEAVQVQLARIATAAAPSLRDQHIPTAVCAAIEAAMAAKPDERPRSAIEFGEWLRRVQHETGLAVDALALPHTVIESGSATAVPVASHTPGTATPPPPPSTATKFRPPAAPHTMIARTRLLALLRDGGDRRLTLIHGPAGFGKTTLALQWATALAAEDVPVAWLTADPDDDNIVWFLSHLIEAIRRVAPELAHELGTLLEERSSDTARYVLSALIDKIHSAGQTMVLVIDDWHRIHAETTCAALDYLLEHGCHHLRLVIASRTRACLPLSRMLVHDELVEIDVAELRFDSQETGAFLADSGGLSLSTDDVNRLQETTEGWPAALQLASLSLRGNDHPAAFIDQLTGRHRALADYLAENVLDSLEPPLLDFLLATSITERVCADLAVRLTDRSDSQELLEEIADRNLFLRRLDEEDQWFQYHHLFADYLRRRLVRRDPARLAQLHRRAAEWCDENEIVTAAVDHALAADDPDYAADLVERRAMDLIEGSRMATFLGLLTKLPQHLAQARPRLQICRAWANVGLQRSEQVQLALDDLSAELDAGAVTGTEATKLRVEAQTVAGAAQFVTDRFDGLPELLVQHLEDADTPFTATNAANLASIDALNRFDFAEARRWQQWAAPYHRRSKGAFGVMYGRCVAGLAALEQLDIAAAEEHFDAAIARTRRGHAQTYGSRMSGALLGSIRYEQNRLDEAEQLLDSSADLGRHGGAVWFLLASFGTGARIKAIRGDLAAAEQRLTQGAEIAEHDSLPRLAARMVNERIRLGLPIPPETRDALRQLPPYRGHDTMIHAGIAELEQDSAIRLLLADHSADQACDRAEQMVRVIESQHRPRAFVRAQLLRAGCLWAAGRRRTATEAALPALALCAEHGLVRTATDDGPHICAIATEARYDGAPQMMQFLELLRTVADTSPSVG